MSIAPAWYPRPPLTVEQYAALPEDSDTKFELQEGNLVMSPRPTRRHQSFIARLFVALEQQTPPEFAVSQDVDLDLQLSAPVRPGFVRAPDLVISSAEAASRVDLDGGFLRADEVLLAVEVLSPGSRRTDSVIKFGEYAEAGIGHYWIVDLDGPTTLRVFRLEAGAYVEVGTFTGDVTLPEPFAIRLELATLGR